MPKFDYKKETVIKLDQGETLKSEKAGVAYDGTFKHGFGYDIYLETYIMPWVLTSIPGLYLKPKYSYGSVWLTKEKLSLDLGLVWNVTNGDKDAKNLLSIVPYVNWGNFMTEYKDSKKLDKKTLGEQFSVALRFGIPINIGK